MQVSCFTCGRVVKRSPSAVGRVVHVFCSRECKHRFEEARYHEMLDAEEKFDLSCRLADEVDYYNETYGG